MDVMPIDLLAYICLKLPTRAILNLAATSKALNEGVELNEFWRSMCIRDYFQFLGEQDRATTVEWKLGYIKIYRSHPKWLDSRAKLTFTSTTHFYSATTSFEYDAANRLAFVGSESQVKSFYLNAQRKLDPLIDYNTAILTPNSYATALAANPKLLVAGTQNGELLVFDKNNQTLLRDMTKPNEYIYAVKFSDNKLVSTSRQGHVRLWDVETGALLEQASDQFSARMCNSLAVNTELNLCVYANGKHIMARDLRSWAKIGQIEAAESFVSCVDLDAQGFKFVAGCTDNRSLAEFKVFNGLNPKPVFTQKVVAWSGNISAAYCDKNKILYSDPRQIIVIDPSTYKVVIKATVNRVSAMSVQSDFIVLGYDRYLGVWSLT